VTYWQGVRVVAMREMRERFRSRVFRVTTVIGAGIVAALIVVPTINDKPKTYDIGLVGKTDPVITAAVQQSGPAVGGKITLHQVASARAARAQVRDGRLDIALVDGRSIIIDDPLDQDRINGRYRLVAAVSESARLQTALTDAGLTSERAADILRRPPLPVQELGKASPNSSDQLTAFIGIIAIFFFFQQYGGLILVGVAEEKSSRIAEVLLAAVRPRQLVSGKVIGIGVVGVAQAIVVAVTAIVASRAVGADVLKGTDAFAALGAVGWFILGFAFYGWAFAAAGSLVSRQSDAQQAGFPITIPIFGGYLASATALGSGDPSTLVRVLAFLPPTAPLCMPTLIADHAVEPWQVAISVALVMVSAVFMARLAGAIYSNSILRTGKRVKWVEALRAA
jgi:ABC-2 type transport system permease protein